MSSRGRRYDGEPKLNIKKVIAVIIVLAVIIMCIALIIKFAKAIFYLPPVELGVFSC